MSARNTSVVHPPPEGGTAAAPLTSGQITSSHHTPQSIARRRRPPSSSFSSCSDFRPKKVTHFFLSAWEEVCWYGRRTWTLGLRADMWKRAKQQKPPFYACIAGTNTAIGKRKILHLTTGSSCGMARVSRSQTEPRNERMNERGVGEHSTYSVIVRSVVTAGCPTKEVSKLSGGVR
jgi:hypothetical protein